MGDLSSIQKEMDEMRKQVASMSSGTDGLQANLQKEMEDMRKQISGLTSQMNETVGQLGGIKDAARKMKDKKNQ